MKRFYAAVAVVEEAGAHAIHLDGRPVRTPARAPLLLPGRALAEAVAEEWRAQGERVEPRTMPCTGFANAAIDRVAPDPDAFAAGLATYAETDLLCYRAEGPAALVEREAAAWDPLLEWARGRYDLNFAVARGIVHVAQPEPTLARLRAAAAARNPFSLAGLSPLVTIGGSLVVALAVDEGAIGPEEAFAATIVDETYQAEYWGEDALAAQAREARRADFLAAARFLDLLKAA